MLYIWPIGLTLRSARDPRALHRKQIFSFTKNGAESQCEIASSNINLSLGFVYFPIQPNVALGRRKSVSAFSRIVSHRDMCVAQRLEPNTKKKHIMKRRKTKKKVPTSRQGKKCIFPELLRRGEIRDIFYDFFPLLFVFPLWLCSCRYISSYVHHTMLLMEGKFLPENCLYCLNCRHHLTIFPAIISSFFVSFFLLYICVSWLYMLRQNDDVECRKRCVYSNYKIPTLDSTSNVNKLFFRHTFSWGAIPPSFSLNLTSMEIFAFLLFSRWWDSSPLHLNEISSLMYQDHTDTTYAGGNFNNFDCMSRLSRFLQSEVFVLRAHTNLFFFREVSQSRAVRRQ